MLRTDLIAPIPELLRRQAAMRGDKIAYRDHQGALSYADLEARTARLAGHLADVGIDAGEAIAILLPNSIVWIEASFAVTRAGAINVPINYESSAAEIAYRLSDADCKAIITTEEHGELVTNLRLKLPNLLVIIVTDPGSSRTQGISYLNLMATTPISGARDSLDIHAPAYIVYTSGTTGPAKGVVLTVHGMLWTVAACTAAILGLNEHDKVLSTLQLTHSYALNVSVLAILATGASAYLMKKFSITEVVDRLSTGEFTLFPGVPTMFHYLLNSAVDLKVPNLRLWVSAGAYLPANLNTAFEDRFGIRLLDGYGTTETSTYIATNGPSGERVLGSCGLPLPGLAVRLVTSSGKDVPIGQEGELIVRGPNIMRGYHNKPEETARALRDGWYYTGDLAKSDENGFLTLTGRLKELINRGGQKIAPGEIEEVVQKHELVFDCAAVGMPHEHLEEVPVVFVQPRAGATIDVESIQQLCRAHLSAYKVPHFVRLVAEIPRSKSGKILRHKLKKSLTT